jgi:hypothetical protein
MADQSYRELRRSAFDVTCHATYQAMHNDSGVRKRRSVTLRRGHDRRTCSARRSHTTCMAYYTAHVRVIMVSDHTIRPVEMRILSRATFEGTRTM